MQPAVSPRFFRQRLDERKRRKLLRFDHAVVEGDVRRPRLVTAGARVTQTNKLHPL